MSWMCLFKVSYSLLEEWEGLFSGKYAIFSFISRHMFCTPALLCEELRFTKFKNTDISKAKNIKVRESYTMFSAKFLLLSG